MGQVLHHVGVVFDVRLEVLTTVVHQAGDGRHDAVAVATGGHLVQPRQLLMNQGVLLLHLLGNTRSSIWKYLCMAPLSYVRHANKWPASPRWRWLEIPD
jgi:hypothetical protein